MPTVPPVLGPGERLDRVNEDLLLLQRKDGLTFGTDAYLLAAFVRDGRGADGVELGSGTGIVSLLCALRRHYRLIHALELQPVYAELTGRNAALNGLGDRLRAVCLDVRDASAADCGGSLRAVWSNPPYLPPESGFRNSSEEKSIARRELNGTIADFCACAARLLCSGGLFTTVYRPDRLPELYSSLRAVRLEPKRTVTVYPDAASPPCLILTEAQKDAAPSLTVSRPLLIYRDGSSPRVLTDDMQRVYDRFTLDFLFESNR